MPRLACSLARSVLPVHPKPVEDNPRDRGSRKPQAKVALITGGESGIGRAVAIALAKEGADVAIVYLDEQRDAQKAKQEVECQGRRAITIAGNVGNEQFCQQAVDQTVQQPGQLDILVSNAGEQFPQQSIEDISQQQVERTFRTNIFAPFCMTKAALTHLQEGSAIANTTSVTAYRGSPDPLDYSATKGAIVAFTRSLARNLVSMGIRVKRRFLVHDGPGSPSRRRRDHL